MRSELSLDLSSPTTLPLDARMAEFRQDPQKMDVMTEFVDEVLTKAQEEAEKKLEIKMADQGKTREGNSSVFAGLKRGRIVTRARGMVMRLFEAICNCTNSAPVPPAQRPSTPKSSAKQ